MQRNEDLEQSKIKLIFKNVISRLINKRGTKKCIIPKLIKSNEGENFLKRANAKDSEN